MEQVSFKTGLNDLDTYELSFSPSSCAEVKNTWIFSSTHPYVFMVCAELNTGPTTFSVHKFM
jgi:hypothetical protein